jgi:hypothetical protein
MAQETKTTTDITTDILKLEAASRAVMATLREEGRSVNADPDR